MAASFGTFDYTASGPLTFKLDGVTEFRLERLAYGVARILITERGPDFRDITLFCTSRAEEVPWVPNVGWVLNALCAYELRTREGGAFFWIDAQTHAPLLATAERVRYVERKHTCKT